MLTRTFLKRMKDFLGKFNFVVENWVIYFVILVGVLPYMTSAKFWDILTPPYPPLSEFYVLFVRQVGVFSDIPPPTSVRTSYMEAP